ncbi:putative holin-like toxin [Desulfosporosinus fructosivorans]
MNTFETISIMIGSCLLIISILKFSYEISQNKK